ncbi:MAG: DUF2764 family protein [Kiritimatiellia bacterium]|nr:DUF2764 family protein [Kiritimatiellia bacterium]
MAYEYLVSSLPMLFLGDPPPFPMAEFRGLCLSLLSPRDEDVLERTLGGRVADTDPAPALDWASKETQIRNACASIRAVAWQTEAPPHLRAHTGFAVWLRDAVADAFSRPAPLERERALARIRWSVLDDLAFSDPMGLAGILAYGLKLQMVERWAGRSEEKGRAMLDQLLNQALETATGAAREREVSE